MIMNRLLITLIFMIFAPAPVWGSDIPKYILDMSPEEYVEHLKCQVLINPQDREWQLDECYLKYTTRAGTVLGRRQAFEICNKRYGPKE